MIREFFAPTWMRIILFPALLFITPAVLKTSTGTLQLEWLAGIKLLAVQETGELTFAAMMLWFAVSYFLACLITVNFEYFTEH